MAFERKAKKSSVLIVEDEVLVAMELSARVEALGYSVVGPARNVNTALDLIDRQAPDTALLDVQLGDQRSTPVAGRLKEMGIRFALVTGYARFPLQEPEFEGASRMGKPVSDWELERMLRQLSE